MVESSKQKEEKKDDALVKDNKQYCLKDLEMIQNKHIRNVIKPIINQSKEWDDEDLNIPRDLGYGIR